MCSSGDNKKVQNTSQQTRADPRAEAAYLDLIGRVNGVMDTPWNSNTAQQVAGFTDDQGQAFQRIRNGVAQPLLDQAQGFAVAGASPITAGSINNYMNPYQQSVIDATMADFSAQNQRQLSGVTGSARMAGSLGGDREQVAKALTAEAQNRTQAPVIAGLHQQGWNTALGAAQQDAGRALQGAGALGNLSQLSYTDINALLGSGGMQQGQQQKVLDAASANAAAQSAYQFQVPSWGASIIGPMGSQLGSTTTGTSTTTGPTPNTWSQAAGLGIAALPYLAAPFTGGASLAAAPLAAGAGKAMAANGGRIGYASGGYVPQVQMPQSAGIQPHQMKWDSGTAPQKGFADHFKEVTDTAKQASEAFKGLNTAATKAGEWMRTEQAPNGWGTLTTTYADPSQNAAYGLQNTWDGITSALGFNDGGRVLYRADSGSVGTQAEIIDDNDPAGTYRMPVPAGPELAPITDMAVRPTSGMIGAGQAYAPPPTDAPPSIAGIVGEVNDLNPRGGVAPAAPPSPASPNLWNRFTNWVQSEEGKKFTGNAGAAMMANSGVGGKGTFGVHLGQGLQSGFQAQDKYQGDMREKAINDAKMKLAERAATIRDAEEGRAASDHPYKQQLTQAEIALKQAQASAGRYQPHDPEKGILDVKTGKVIPPAGGTEDRLQRIFNTEFAKDAPKYIKESAAAYADAEGMASSVRELSALAPYAETGWGQDQILALRKMGARFGLDVSDKIAPTELFRSLSQNFVLQAAQKLKPLSNSDVVFVQRGLATIESDPNTLKTMLPGMEAVAKRQAMVEDMKMAAYGKGRMPDYRTIMADVDKAIPSPIIAQYGTKAPAATAAPAQKAAASQEPAAPSPEILAKRAAVPDGTLVMFRGAPHIKKGDYFVPAPKDMYERGIFGSYSTRGGPAHSKSISVVD